MVLSTVRRGAERGPWLELGACVLGNPSMKGWEKIIDGNEHGNGAGSACK